MPVPNFMRHVNKRVFNRLEVAAGKRPVLAHVGRSTGREYRTPLEAFSVEGGFAFVLMYGADRTDWVQNVLESGEAELAVGGHLHRLVNPRIETSDAAWDRLPPDYKRPPGFLNVRELLVLDAVTPGPSPEIN